MKKIIIITFIAAFALSSCNKDSQDVSYVVTYPTLTLKGDAALTIPIGGTYEEKGSVVKEGANDYSNLVKVTGAVNPSVLGVYTITYTYKSAGKIYPQDSMTLVARRYIGVIAPGVDAIDFSGTYRRNAGAKGFAVVKKLGYPGLYTNNNPGGATSDGTVTGASVDNIVVYMFQIEPTKVSAPSQDTSAGEFACTNGSYNAANNSFTWVCINSGYGTAARTFIKQ
jgi:hypothetical protein